MAAAGLWVLGALPMTAAATSCAGKVPASQEVATLRRDLPVYRTPAGQRHGSVSDSRPITTEATTLPVLQSITRSGTRWLLVRLPGRPNSHTGWVRATHTWLHQLTWHLVVATGPRTASFSSQRRVYVYNHGCLVRDWLVVVGKPSTPTPHGEFFVEEDVDEGAGAVGGPWALATSARSGIFREFDGGPGQIALHGMDGGLEATPGTAVSHGCVRLLDKDIIWLANRIDPGTPVTITR